MVQEFNENSIIPKFLWLIPEEGLSPTITAYNVWPLFSIGRYCLFWNNRSLADRTETVFTLDHWNVINKGANESSLSVRRILSNQIIMQYNNIF